MYGTWFAALSYVCMHVCMFGTWSATYFHEHKYYIQYKRTNPHACIYSFRNVTKLCLQVFADLAALAQLQKTLEQVS